jgi:hypothetical protein
MARPSPDALVMATGPEEGAGQELEARDRTVPEEGR